MNQTFDVNFNTLWTGKLKTRPSALAFSADSKILCVGDIDGSIYVFDMLTGKLLIENHGREKGPIVALYLHDQFLYSFDRHGVFTHWLYPSFKKLKECSIPTRKEVEGVFFSPEFFPHALFNPNANSLIFVTSQFGSFIPDSYIRQISLDQLPDFDPINIEKKINGARSSFHLPPADTDNEVDSLTLSKNGRQFAVTRRTSYTTSDGDWGFCFPQYLTIFDDQPMEKDTMYDGNQFFDYRFSGSSGPFPYTKNVAAFSPDGKKILVSSNEDGCFYLIDCPSTQSLETHTPLDKPLDECSAMRPSPRFFGDISCLDWSSFSDLIAAGSSEGEIALWNSNERQHILTKKLFNEAVEFTQFSSDGKYLIVLTEKGEVVVFSNFT